MARPACTPECAPPLVWGAPAPGTFASAAWPAPRGSAPWVLHDFFEVGLQTGHRGAFVEVLVEAQHAVLAEKVGTEGVFGLQRAFRMAGVKFMIVSLWDVPDQQTQELMRLFYQNWLEHKESLRDAFNHAQQRLREKEPSPEMWAGFVLIE